MKEKFEKMRVTLQTKLDTAVGQLEQSKDYVKAKSNEAEDDIHAKLEEAKAKMKASKQEFDAAKARAEVLIEEKKEELDSRVTQWKADREHDKLANRARRAEEYAEACIELAVASAVEADGAILEAAIAWMDADNAAH